MGLDKVLLLSVKRDVVTRWSRALAAVGLALAVLPVGCFSDSSTLTLDTSDIASIRLAGLIVDPLQGEVKDGHACFWVSDPAGWSASLIWPPGTVAKDDPLRVEDGRGHVLATVGDTIKGWGGNTVDGEGCHEGSERFYLRAIEPPS